MNKTKRLCFLSVLIALTVTQTINAQNCKTLKVSGANYWLPVSYIDPLSKDSQGISIDLLKYIASQLAIPVETDLTVPWKRVLDNLANGNIDLVSAMYKTRSREKKYHFTNSYFTNEVKIFVMKGKKFPFKRLEDLKGRTGGIPIGSSFGEEFDQFSSNNSLNLIGLKTKNQLVGMLQLGRIDYFIQDKLDAQIYLKKHNLSDSIVALTNSISFEDVHFSLSRQSPCASLLPQINTIIQTAQYDGTLQKIIDHHTH